MQIIYEKSADKLGRGVNLNHLKIFNSEEFGSIRTVEVAGKIYFVGKDLANALGYSNPRDAIARHCKGVVKHDSFKEGGQEVALLPEGDMYRLITHSKLESAERFESWVFDEVLPSIRQTGSYQVKELSPEEMMRIQLGMLDEQRKRLGGVETRVDKLENTMTIDYGQQQELQSLAKAVAVNAVGGKKSRAYTYQYPPADENDRPPKMYGMVISRLWHDYQDFFSVNSYKNTPVMRFDEALKYLDNWQPPINMQLEIGRINRMEDSENGD